jgi:hypothetical protein
MLAMKSGRGEWNAEAQRRSAAEGNVIIRGKDTASVKLPILSLQRPQRTTELYGLFEHRHTGTECQMLAMKSRRCPVSL